MANSIRQLMIAAGILLIFTAAINAQSSSQDTKSEVEIRGLFAVPSGEASILGTTTGGNTIDFSRDFDFKNQFGFELRYTYRTEDKKHKVLLNYNHIDWNRTTSLSRSFTFLGQTYVANFNATGDLSLGYFRAEYAYRWGNDKFRIGPMADMGVITTRVKVS